jgi:hypothetical protein
MQYLYLPSLYMHGILKLVQNVFHINLPIRFILLAK